MLHSNREIYGLIRVDGDVAYADQRVVWEARHSKLDTRYIGVTSRRRITRYIGVTSRRRQEEYIAAPAEYRENLRQYLTAYEQRTTITHLRERYRRAARKSPTACPFYAAIHAALNSVSAFEWSIVYIGSADAAAEQATMRVLHYMNDAIEHCVDPESVVYNRARGAAWRSLVTDVKRCPKCKTD